MDSSTVMDLLTIVSLTVAALVVAWVISHPDRGRRKQ